MLVMAGATTKQAAISRPAAAPPTWPNTRVYRDRETPLSWSCTTTIDSATLQTMDSEPGSPMSSSGSASPTEEQPIDPSRFSSSRELPSYVNSGKRPLPGSSSFMYGSSTKNRRREDSFPRRNTGGPSAVYPEIRENPSGPRPQRDELLDMSVVEQTRRDWGDPFDDTAVKNAS